MKEITEVDGRSIELYFRQDIYPEEFLSKLHRVMVNHVCAFSRREQIDMEELTADIDFLESIYRVTSEAMLK